ncbi:MAG TPA: S8 family serine peptidase [Polyangiaceae bacterium]|jgi:MYXO-CTERM domain-containing protein
MLFLRRGLIALLATAALGVTGSARADEPSRSTLPPGISVGRDGRYYQDVCDHSVAFHCLTKRLLPPTYRPLDGPFAPAGGGQECTCTAQTCGGGFPTAPSGSLDPKNILAAYSVPPSSAAGGKIVALIDLPDANALHDVNIYRKQFGIPALVACPGNGLPDPAGGTPCFATVDETGNVTTSAGDCQQADGETGLDTEMVSAACPDCSILLVQLTTAYANGGPSDTDFVTATKAAITLGAVAVSISFGGPENVGFDPTGKEYTTPGHLVLAAAGDSGYLNEGSMFGSGTPSYPASATDVLAVGGTTLELTGATYGEVVWNDGAMGGAGGSGCSTEFAMPGFQKTFLSANADAFGTCAKRASVDVSAAAEYVSGQGGFSGAIAEYDSVNGWGQVVGTSAASPMVAGLFTRLGLIDAVSGNLGWVYDNIAAFKDVTQGDNDLGTTGCTTVMCQAGKGWDGPTGVGTPIGTKLAALVAPPPEDGGTEGGTEGEGGAEPASSPSQKGGCGCVTAGAAGDGAPLLLALGVGLGAFAARRRRSTR